MLNLAQRKNLYQIFSDLFRYPDQALLSRYDQCLAELAELLDMELPAELHQAPDMVALETAYTGLFVNSFGGTPAPPYGSVYLDPGGLLMGQSSLSVAACYAEENLNLQGSDEPPDFLATELEFLYYLLAEEELATAAGNSKRLAELKARQVDFFTKYFVSWIPDFCDRLAGQSSDPFYLWVGKALQHFCNLEKQQLVEKTANQNIASSTS